MIKGSTIFWLGVLVLILLGIGAAFFIKPAGADLRPLAQCLGEKGATFYGAFWCPHCTRQKAVFGSAASDLPYVECSTPDGKGQLSVCIDKEITNYPTWEFADGSRVTGEQSVATLAARTGCELPREETTEEEEIEEGGMSDATS